MYFVIQVVSRTENEMMRRIRMNVDPSLIVDMFVPTRERMRKEDGKWVSYEERCFPGYIFIETNEPKKVSSYLRGIEGFARMVGFGNLGNISFMPLSEEEERVINSLIGKNNSIELSKIAIEEGKQIRVISGPLEGFTGKVIKYNLHKRTVMVELDLGGVKNQLQLGIEIIEGE